MTRRALLIVAGALALFAGGCRHENEPNKIVEPLPNRISPVAVPAQMGQAWFLTKRDVLAVVIPVMNRTTVAGSTYPELTGPDSQTRYAFQTAERHYGTASFFLQFRDTNNNVIDPIQSQASTATLQGVFITGSANIPGFSYTESMTLSLDTPGLISGTMHLTGLSTYNGSGHSLTITLASPGAKSSFEGMTDGTATGTGSGPNSEPNSLSLTFSADHTANGSIAWEGESGGIHYEPNASGYIVTNQYRLLLE